MGGYVGPIPDVPSDCIFSFLILIGALATTNWYVEYELLTLVRGLQCSGNESAVLDCSTSLTSNSSCSASSDASVICPGIHASH